MNRRVLFGCLGAVVLIALVALVFLYLYVFKPAGEVMGDIKQMGALHELNAGITLPDGFEAPADGALTAPQVERFARVQDRMRETLDMTYTELTVRAIELRAMGVGAEDREARPGFRELLGSFKGLGPLMTEAKQAQVDALNLEKFSLAEYRWVRESAYRALGRDRGGQYLEDFAERVAKKGGGDAEEDEAPVEVAVPESNRALLAPYTEAAEAWEPFLVFGL